MRNHNSLRNIASTLLRERAEQRHTILQERVQFNVHDLTMGFVWDCVDGRSSFTRHHRKKNSASSLSLFSSQKSQAFQLLSLFSQLLSDETNNHHAFLPFYCIVSPDCIERCQETHCQPLCSLDRKSVARSRVLRVPSEALFARETIKSLYKSL
jgi:hypothetical protein